MKNYLPLLFTSMLFVACNTGTKEKEYQSAELVPVNTAGYAISNASTDVAKPSQVEGLVSKPTPKQIVKVNKTPATEKQPAPIVEQKPSAPVTNTGNTGTVPEITGPSSTASSSAGADPAGDKTSTTPSETASTKTEQVKKKKGWSDAAKGAAIGGAVGAIGGAVINGRNRGVGAVVGAVIGAAGGYAIGRKRDKNREANQENLAAIW